MWFKGANKQEDKIFIPYTDVQSEKNHLEIIQQYGYTQKSSQMKIGIEGEMDHKAMFFTSDLEEPFAF